VKKSSEVQRKNPRRFSKKIRDGPVRTGAFLKDIAFPLAFSMASLKLIIGMQETTSCAPAEGGRPLAVSFLSGNELKIFRSLS